MRVLEISQMMLVFTKKDFLLKKHSSIFSFATEKHYCRTARYKQKKNVLKALIFFRQKRFVEIGYTIITVQMSLTKVNYFLSTAFFCQSVYYKKKRSVTDLHLRNECPYVQIIF